MKLFQSGSFFTGCNYWASHAGTNMWSDWQPQVVEEDFARLAQAKIQVLRVFPLWSNFQPLRMHRGAGNEERELRLGEKPLPFTPEGQAGVDPVMAQRFGDFCSLAEKYGFQLIVGLVTGWMSGRMHTPEAFAGRDLLRDPLVIRWQLRFVRYMVRTFRDRPAIAAWDLGNECNCMGQAGRDDAYLWTSAITSAIKLEDSSRPVVSGLHGLNPAGSWTPEDQGELLDILCTHPYPLFTPHCDTDPLNQMKSVLHATAESVLYASLGQKPCFVEEAGTLGPMIADEETAADYIRTAMLSAWAHDLRGFVWWCANEQSALTHTPYDWSAVERELGLFRLDGSPKPVCRVFRDFAAKLEDFGEPLPPRITDGVCVLTRGQDSWAAAYGAFLLAKKAGLDITFAWCEDALPAAPVYLLPALTTDTAISGHQLAELLRRVYEEGASLYLSLNETLLSPFSQYTGVQVKTRRRRTSPDQVELDGEIFQLQSPIRMELEAVSARPLALDQEGRPVFSVNQYGKGRVYFCAYPLELEAACTPGVISGPEEKPLHRFYEKMALWNPIRTLELDRSQPDAPYVGLTEHPLAEGGLAAVLVNHTPEPRRVLVRTGGLSVRKLLPFTQAAVSETAEGLTVELPGNTGLAAVLG